MPRDSYIHHAKAPAPGAPLVFTFHGTGGDEHQFPGLIQQILPEAGVISPRGDVSENGANRFFRRRAEGDYDMEDLTARTAQMKAFIAAHRAEHPGAPIYGLGYSNGANILASVIFEAPELFDRVVLMHPLIPWTPKANAGLARLKLLITAGERDPICPLPLTNGLTDWLRAQGGPVDLHLHSGGHEITQGELSAIGAFLSTP